MNPWRNVARSLHERKILGLFVIWNTMAEGNMVILANVVADAFASELHSFGSFVHERS